MGRLFGGRVEIQCQLHEMQDVITLNLMKKKPFRPNLFFVVAILAVVGLAYYARKTSSQEIHVRVDEPKVQFRKIAQMGDPKANVPTVGLSSDLNVEEPVKKWVHDEAPELNRRNVDMKAYDERIEREIANYGEVQLQQLKVMAIDKTLPINERILSTYMLGKSSMAAEHLSEIASQNVEYKQHAPHSEGEIRASQERAIKIMSIDGIVKGEQSPQQKIENLKNIIKSSNDSLVKDYAQTKLNDLRKSL